MFYLKWIPVRYYSVLHGYFSLDLFQIFTEFLLQKYEYYDSEFRQPPAISTNDNKNNIDIFFKIGPSQKIHLL